MSSNINPFVVSGKIPKAYFCDRVIESEHLEKSLTNQLNVVLTSSRRMGKTALVDYALLQSKAKRNFKYHIPTKTLGKPVCSEVSGGGVCC